MVINNRRKTDGALPWSTTMRRYTAKALGSSPWLWMWLLTSCLSNEKFERLSGPLDEIVLFCTNASSQWHESIVYQTLLIMTSFNSRDMLPRRWLLHWTFLMRYCQMILHWYCGYVKRNVFIYQHFVSIKDKLEILGTWNRHVWHVLKNNPQIVTGVHDKHICSANSVNLINY